MRKVQFLLSGCVLLASVAVVMVIIQKKVTLHEKSINTDAIAKGSNESIVQMLQNEKVVAFNRWYAQDGEDKNLLCIVKAFDQDPNYDGKGVKLSVLDQSGTEIYSDYFSSVNHIYPISALRKGSTQLVIEFDYGGNTSFLKMLDYHNGKIVNLTKAIEPDNDFTAGAEVRPQFRSTVNPAMEPFQVQLTQGSSGLPSAGEKYTKTFRYKDNFYQYIGEFSQQKVDDYIEKLMEENAVKNKKSVKPIQSEPTTKQ